MIDPTLQTYLDRWAKAWSGLPADASVAARRSMLETLSDQARKPLPSGMTSEVMHVPAKRPVRVRLFRPAVEGPLPALIYMHGGGWMQGSPETHDEITAYLAQQTGHLVVSVDYALAPELPFPAALDDCTAVAHWLVAEARSLNVAADRISTAGDSAGANLAAALCLKLRGALPHLRAQLLFYPPVDFAHNRPSVQKNANGPIITAQSLGPVADMYLPNADDRLNPLAAPILATDHAGLPPAFIAVAEHDPLRDEGRDYAAHLRAAGVAVDLDEGRGLFHGYLRAMSEATIARKPLDRACAWLNLWSAHL
ncbi:MAG: alpha/beta hydrolase [Alphaproteobacteria bacterium]|nr:alpha/beta hydrolase [Alphaproteobacteria bacterium]